MRAGAHGGASGRPDGSPLRSAVSLQKGIGGPFSGGIRSQSEGHGHYLKRLAKSRHSMCRSKLLTVLTAILTPTLALESRCPCQTLSATSKAWCLGPLTEEVQWESRTQRCGSARATTMLSTTARWLSTTAKGLSEMRELAMTMTSEENRKDLEWVAARYEALAKAAELLDSSGHTSPIDIAMLRPFRK